MQLSNQQYDKVSDLVESVDLKNYQLKLDLLDHIACSIEDLMVDGQSFEEAARDVFHTFSKRHIKQIEYTTEVLTTDTMKKRTKIIGVIGLILTLTGAGMKLMHLPGAAITFGVGVLVLGIGFFTSNAIDTIPKFDSVKGKVVQIIGAVGAFMTLTGGMFKMLHLPGAGQLIIIGPILLLTYYSFSSLIRTKVPE